MAEHNDAVGKGLIRPRRSPTPEHRPKRKDIESLSDTAPKTNTPEHRDKKRLRPTGSSSSQKLARDSKLELNKSSGGSSSVAVELNGMVANLGTMAKMLERVMSTDDFINDPVMACIVCAQSVILACTAQLISKREAQPPARQVKDSSTKAAAEHS